MSDCCCHLHVHSEYSLLDGQSSVDALAMRAAEMDQPALGLTDHGVMNGVVDLAKACKKYDIKPVFGSELYFVEDRLWRPEEKGQKVKRYHITLVAATQEGYTNLVRLSSLGFLEGLHGGKPAVDMAAFAQYGKGIIATTGCLGSRFCQCILNDDIAGAREYADSLVQVFGKENVYFEVQKNGLDDQDKANVWIVKLAAEFGCKLVATGDVHYLRREDYNAHASLLCVQTKSTLAMPKMTFETNEFYLKDNQEMATAFAEWPEALASTLEIAERCDVEMKLGQELIPRYLPEGEDEAAMLRELVQEGLATRYGLPIPAEAQQRADFELETVGKMGFDAYFLIVWDFVKWAKDNGIAVGPGRGSAAGSIVAYSLRITDVDPIAHGLLFERFLNPERVSMPDIDIDFSVRGRERVMAYVVEKYGRESVAQIITFGRMFPRAALRDAARVLGESYSVGDALAKKVPDPQAGRPPSFEDCLVDGQELKKAYDTDSVARAVIDLAQGFEGVVRNNSIHAAAVVIAGQPLTDIVPLQLADSGTKDASGNTIYRQVTQVSMKPVEEIGLLKMDFLGLRNLDVIEDALDIIERSTGTRPDMATLPMDDSETYEMMARGDSIGVFQFESEGMQEALKKVRPTEFDDLVALVALYRPGAMSEIPTYAEGKRDPDTVNIPDPRLEPILRPTMGVILYQEQAMLISKELAGFSGAQADDLRKAIGKKNREAMAKLKPAFIEGCKASGVAPKVIDWIWATNEKSADYSFNRSHAACYALIAYQTAWLKAHYPAEYMAALISSVMDTKDKVPFFMAQTERMGIDILPPDVNQSQDGFIVIDGKIRFGLGAIKGVGHKVVRAITAERERGGPYKSIWDFCRRVDGQAVNKKVLEALVHSGAFDSTGETRRGLFIVVGDAQKIGAKSQKDQAVGQDSLFAGSESFDQQQDPPISTEEYEEREILKFEREATGLYLSSHPMQSIRTQLLQAGYTLLTDLTDEADGSNVVVCGMVNDTREIRTKNGTQMMFVDLADIDGKADLVVFADVLDMAREILTKDTILVASGRLDIKEGNAPNIVVREVAKFDPEAMQAAANVEDDLRAFDEEPEAPCEPLVIALDSECVEVSAFEAAVAASEEHEGGEPVQILVFHDGQQRRMTLRARVNGAPAVRDHITTLLGGEAVSS